MVKCFHLKIYPHQLLSLRALRCLLYFFQSLFIKISPIFKFLGIFYMILQSNCKSFWTISITKNYNNKTIALIPMEMFEKFFL